MREIVETTQFKKDFRKISSSGRYKIQDIFDVIDLLANNKPLPRKYCDHPLTGEDARECHIKPDWLLIYKKDDNKLKLVRTGSHSELF